MIASNGETCPHDPFRMARPLIPYPLQSKHQWINIIQAHTIRWA